MKGGCSERKGDKFVPKWLEERNISGIGECKVL